MLKDHDRFAKICAGFQSIALIIAVVIGGIWTRYTFITLNSAGKANAELQKVRAENQRQPVLWMDITSAQHESRAGGYDLTVDVLIENKGAVNTKIGWVTETPLAVAEVREGTVFQKPENPFSLLGFGDATHKQYLILIGGRRHFEFAGHVPHAGIYYLEFQAGLNPADLGDAAKQLGPLAGTPWVWSDSSLLVVRP
jgi:hypothetical protein